MTQPLRLILGVHLHQPVGNFDSVLESAYQHAYKPFADVIRGFQKLSWTIHCSGFLLKWLAGNHPEYVETLREMVQSDRLEILGGGMYEPILPVIPQRDRIGQIRRLSEEVEKLFGRSPKGLWLAERVWEPGLVSDLCAAGMEYVFLDDYHFFASGWEPERLDGYFMVEDLAHAIGVFPISERLRYVIPWVEAPKAVEELCDMARGGRRLAVMLDDGEKFGSWPKTGEWVYGKGWLRDFCRGLEGCSDLVKTVTPSKYWSSNAPAGRAALPVASYIEMGQWALPAERSLRFEQWRERFEKEGWFADLKPFMHGGIWRNFLVKYPESNYLQKRVLLLSREFDTEEKRSLPAYDHLLRAQCNDVYWHGVFGGLYLPHLRHEAFRNLIEAQKGLEHHLYPEGPPPVRITHEDFDLDRDDEYIIDHPEYFMVVSPAKGGAMMEWSFKPRGTNLLAVLTRRKEKYHLSGGPSAQVVRLGSNPADRECSGPDASDDFVFDSDTRYSCREVFIAKPPRAARLKNEGVRPDRSFVRAHFGVGADCEFGIPLAGEQAGFQLRKRYRPLQRAASVEISYQYAVPERYSGWLGVEWNLGIAGGGDPEKCVYPLSAPEAARGLARCTELDGVSGLVVENRREGYRVVFEGSAPISVRAYPVETVTLSIDSLEKTYQGLCVWLFAPLAGAEGGVVFTATAEAI